MKPVHDGFPSFCTRTQRRDQFSAASPLLFLLNNLDMDDRFFFSFLMSVRRKKKKKRKKKPCFQSPNHWNRIERKKRRAIKSSKCISLRPLTIITHSHASPEDFKLRPLRLISPREARNVTCRYVRQYTCDVLFKPYRKTKSALPGVDDTRDGF